MSISIKDFIGTWNVRWVDGQEPWMSSGWTILIGTGTQGASVPFLNAEYDTCVGFTVLDQDGVQKLSSAEQAELHQAMALLFSQGTLQWTGYYEGQPLRINIAAAEAQTPSGERTVSLYSSTVYGDPDQVGVWGADGEGSP